MARATGAEVKAAFKKAAAWGTPVVCGARDGVMILPSGFKRSRGSIVDNSLGRSWPADADPTEIKAEGDLKSYLRYMGLDLLLALAMGTSAAPTYTTPTNTGTATGGSATTLVNSGAGWTPDALIGKWVTITAGTNAGKTRYITDNDATSLTFATMTTACDATSVYSISGLIATHVYQLAESVEGLFATGAIYNGVNVDELTTFKIAGFSIKGSIGQAIEISFDLLAHNRDTGSTTNTSVTIANVTWPEIANRLLYSHLVMRMNAASGDALDSGDNIYPSSFELSFKRKLTGLYGSGGSFDLIDEPIADGMPEVTLKLEFPRYESVAYFTAWDAGTEQKLDMIFTGALLGGTTYRSFKLEFPRLKFTNVEAPMVEGIWKQPVDMIALVANSAPAGMSGLTLPFRVTSVNGYGGDPLQAGN